MNSTLPGSDSPFHPGRRQGYLALVAIDGVRVDNDPAIEAPPGSPITSSAATPQALPDISPEEQARHIAIIANDDRSPVIIAISRIISVIRTAGAAWRMLKSIPDEVRAALKVARAA